MLTHRLGTHAEGHLVPRKWDRRRSERADGLRLLALLPLLGLEGHLLPFDQLPIP